MMTTEGLLLLALAACVCVLPHAHSQCSSDDDCVNGMCNLQFACVCDQGFIGDLCDIADIDECASEPCQNGGLCFQSPVAAGYVCVCNDDKTGVNCESDFCNYPQTLRDSTWWARYATGEYSPVQADFYDFATSTMTLTSATVSKTTFACEGENPQSANMVQHAVFDTSTNNKRHCVETLWYNNITLQRQSEPAIHINPFPVTDCLNTLPTAEIYPVLVKYPFPLEWTPTGSPLLLGPYHTVISNATIENECLGDKNAPLTYVYEFEINVGSCLPEATYHMPFFDVDIHFVEFFPSHDSQSDIAFVAAMDNIDPATGVEQGTSFYSGTIKVGTDMLYLSFNAESQWYTEFNTSATYNTRTGSFFAIALSPAMCAELSPCVNGECVDTLGPEGPEFSCICPDIYEGLLCDQEIAECTSTSCENDGTCVENVAATGYTCLCADGFVGNVCQTNVDECASSPCQNNATCYDEVNGYTCTCPDGYAGIHCETVLIDLCSPSPCVEGSCMQPSRTAYICICNPGYGGINCDKNLDECSSESCQNGGTCIDAVNSYTCICPAGYTGIQCETDIDECSSSPCLNGTCTEPRVNAYECICKEGHSGINCDDKVNECDSSPCRNGGTCVDGVDSFTCLCPQGTSGPLCENGDCHLPSLFTSTSWFTKYDASFGHIKVSFNSTTLFEEDSLIEHMCVAYLQRGEDHFVVFIDQSTFRKSCAKINVIRNIMLYRESVPGVADISLDECVEAFNNGLSNQVPVHVYFRDPLSSSLVTGDCRLPEADFLARYKEQATDDFSCSFDMTSTAVINGGGNALDMSSCYGALVDYEHPFTGVLLECVDVIPEQVIDGRDSGFGDGVVLIRQNPTRPGTYFIYVARYHVEGNELYLSLTTKSPQYSSFYPPADYETADDIHQLIQLIADNCNAHQPCQNGGTCEEVLPSYNCKCLPGFIGEACQTDVDECFSEPCQHGGTCYEQTDSYTCVCLDGYSGENCQHFDPCFSSPCMNGGICDDQLDGTFYCRCLPGFTGYVCETEIQECASVPCYYGGTCVEKLNSYECVCKPGYTGTNCETDIDECASSPCQNQGVCEPRPLDGYDCKCPPLFYGTHCEHFDDCHIQPCLNGGTCQDGQQSYYCFCPDGYTGHFCETKLTTCYYNDYRCFNGGTCVADEYDDEDFTCICAPGYTGDNCQITTPCTPGKCHNNGECKRLSDTAYDCECRPEFEGRHCELIKDTKPCSLNPCFNGGTCNQTGALTYRCLCPGDYYGEKCENRIGFRPLYIIIIIVIIVVVCGFFIIICCWCALRGGYAGGSEEHIVEEEIITESDGSTVTRWYPSYKH